MDYGPLVWWMALAVATFLVSYGVLGLVYGKKKERRTGGRYRPVTQTRLGLEVMLFSLLSGYHHIPVGSICYQNGRNQALPGGFYRISRHSAMASGETAIWGELVFPAVVSDCWAEQIVQRINHPTQCEHHWHYGPDRPAGDPESAEKMKELAAQAAREEAAKDEADPERVEIRQFWTATHGAGIAGMTRVYTQRLSGPGYDQFGAGTPSPDVPPRAE